MFGLISLLLRRTRHLSRLAKRCRRASCRLMLRALVRKAAQRRAFSTARPRPWTHAAAVAAGSAAANDGLTLQAVGVFSGPHRARNGTPRQGCLAPHARGTVRLYEDVLAGGSGDALEGLAGFSHAILLWHVHDAVRGGCHGDRGLTPRSVRTARRPRSRRRGWAARVWASLPRERLTGLTHSASPWFALRRWRAASFTFQVPTFWTARRCWTSSHTSRPTMQ